MLVHLRVAAVADHQLLLGIEHAQAVRHVAQRHVEQQILPAQLLLAAVAGRRADAAVPRCTSFCAMPLMNAAPNADSMISMAPPADRQRHGGVIDPARNHDDGRIVLHADGTHGREVHEADRQRQQRSARPTAHGAAAGAGMPPWPPRPEPCRRATATSAQAEIPLQLCPARPGPACRRSAWRRRPRRSIEPPMMAYAVARPGRNPKASLSSRPPRSPARRPSPRARRPWACQGCRPAWPRNAWPRCRQPALMPVSASHTEAAHLVARLRGPSVTCE